MTKEEKNPTEDSNTDNDVPVFTAWNRWYALVLMTLIVIIVLLTIFSRMFV